MGNICRNCGSVDVIVKGDEIYCPCCGKTFKIETKKNDEVVPKINKLSIIEKMFKEVVSIQALVDTTIKVGTAFFISSKYALTNAHILFDENNESKAGEVVGKNYEGNKTYHFEIVAYDLKLDIALLESKDVSAFNFANFSQSLTNGEAVYAIGNSKGEGLCIVDGLVSDKSRVIDGVNYIMCSAIVTNGNSGGPLFNERGFVIGMITMSTPDEVSMNYALPVKEMTDFIDRVKLANNVNL